MQQAWHGDLGGEMERELSMEGACGNVKMRSVASDAAGGNVGKINGLYNGIIHEPRSTPLPFL